MCVCVCVCVSVCVCSYICLKFIYNNNKYLQQKPCPSVNSQNVAISLVIRYYRCRDLETCLMLNQKS